MLLLDLTLPGAAENLALDEALLEEAEQSERGFELLRLWEPKRMIAVVGRSSRLSAEVDIDACHASRIPVVRRTSGGAAILAGPGCLMYSVILSLERHTELSDVSAAHRFVLGRLTTGITPHVEGVRCRGTSDLVVGDRKFSGNSLRLRKRHLLYHGTLLYNFPLDAIWRYLVMPPRMPDYRAGRPHEEFVMNLPIDGPALRGCVIGAWQANEHRASWPAELTQQLVETKYSQTSWNEQLM